MKIALPDSVLRQVVEMVKSAPKDEQMKCLTELTEVFATIMSTEVKKLHEVGDLDTLRDEYKITPANIEEEDIPMPEELPGDQVHEFDSADELIGFLKRKLDLTN